MRTRGEGGQKSRKICVRTKWKPPYSTIYPYHVCMVEKPCGLFSMKYQVKARRGLTSTSSLYLIVLSIGSVIVRRFAAAANFRIEKRPPKLDRAYPTPKGLAELGHPRHRSRRRRWTKVVDDVRGDDRGRGHKPEFT